MSSSHRKIINTPEAGQISFKIPFVLFTVSIVIIYILIIIITIISLQ